MISFVAFVVWDGVLWWCPGCPKPFELPCLPPWQRIKVCHSGLYPILCRLAPLPRTLLPVLWDSSAYPALKSPGPHLSHAQPLWPGKSVWLVASLSPQESASLELLQTGGPATTAALPVFAHLCHPRLEEELTLWLAPHQYIEMRWPGVKLRISRLPSLLAGGIPFLLAWQSREPY